MILALDPGINGCGCALFNPQSGYLHRAEYVRSHAKKDMTGAARVIGMNNAVSTWLGKYAGMAPEFVVCEVPQVYQGSKQKGDPNDLITLALVVGAVSTLGKAVVYYAPREWKGQTEPNAMAKRILGRLNQGEETGFPNYVAFATALEEAMSAGREIGHLDHNTVDAIGIGLKFLGRLEPKRVIVR